jgi:hypothetical protein
MIVVVAVAVIELLLSEIVGGAGDPPTTGAKLKVTPAGTPLKVRRISEPFVTGVPLLELCVAVRHADAKPSFMRSEPVASGSVRFVKMVALALLVWPPPEPIAMLPMPGPRELITVSGPGVVKM